MNHLKHYILLAIFLAISVPALAESLPPNILSQLPKNYEVMTYVSGELNGDKLTDYLVAVNKKGEENKSQWVNETAPRRPLFIFIQNTNETFSLAKRNDNVIFAMDEGGQCDPFMDGEDGLALKNHYFTVQNSVACGQHWQDFITFHYDAKSNDWLFHKRVFESAHLNNSDDPNAEALVSDKAVITKAKVNHPISFEKYHPF